MLHTDLIPASQKIHGILLQSIEVSDYCFGKPGFWGAINKLFRKIDFAASSQKMKKLIINIDYCINGIKAIQVDSFEEKDYLSTLIRFAESLKKTNQEMDAVVQVLAHKADGGALSYGDYNHLIKQYDEANYIRGQIGEELNQKYQNLLRG